MRVRLRLLLALTMAMGIVTTLAPPASATTWVRYDSGQFSHYASGIISHDGYDELVDAIICSGQGVTGQIGEVGDDTSYADVVTVSFRVDETGPFGTYARCTVWLLKREVNCSIWGCSRGEWFTTSYARTAGPYYVDQTPPTVVPRPSAEPNDAGWHNAAFTVSWDIDDALSGVHRNASCGFADDRVERDGRGMLTRHCRDSAGNQAPSRHFAYRLDTVAPTLSPTVSSSRILVRDTVNAEPVASDATSGVRTAQCNDGRPLDTSTPGTHTFACSATDRADNTSSTSVSYVVGYAVSAFTAPVDPSAPTRVKAGRAVPLKFQVTDGTGAAVPGLSPGDVELTTTSLSCELGVTDDLDTESTAGGRGLIDHGNGNYQLNWQTPKSYASSCKRVELTVAGAPGTTAVFEFVR